MQFEKGQTVGQKAVILKITDPDGVETDYTAEQVTKVNAGNYRVNAPVIMAGVWKYSWEEAALPALSKQPQLLVTNSTFASPN